MKYLASFRPPYCSHTQKRHTKLFTVEGPGVKPPTAPDGSFTSNCSKTLLLAVANSHSKSGTRPPFDLLLRRVIAPHRVLDHVHNTRGSTIRERCKILSRFEILGTLMHPMARATINCIKQQSPHKHMAERTRVPNRCLEKQSMSCPHGHTLRNIICRGFLSQRCSWHLQKRCSRTKIRGIISSTNFHHSC